MLLRDTCRKDVSARNSSASKPTVVIFCFKEQAIRRKPKNARSCRLSRQRRSWTRAQGRVGYRRTQVRIEGDHVALLDRFEQPAGLDLVTVEFDNEREAEEFSVP